MHFYDHLRKFIEVPSKRKKREIDRQTDREGDTGLGDGSHKSEHLNSDTWNP